MARMRMLEHTADVGFEVEADSLPGVFEAAAGALLRVLFEAGLPRQGGRRERLVLTAADLETLMVRWLDELIYRVQTRGEVPVRTRVQLAEVPEGHGIEAELELLPFEEVRDRFAGEVKAATYHGLAIEAVDGRFRARVILDV